MKPVLKKRHLHYLTIASQWKLNIIKKTEITIHANMNQKQPQTFMFYKFPECLAHWSVITSINCIEYSNNLLIIVIGTLQLWQ